MTNRLYNTEDSIRLGAISFVNTVPIYSSYQPSPNVEVVYEVPARLNQLMRSGQLELSPVSSACYLRNQEQFVLLEDLSVSSPGAVESVLFLSRAPLGPELLDTSVINIPDDSETSVMLLAHLLEEATGQDLRPWFRVYEAQNYEQALQESGNALIIGDNALMMKARLNSADATFHCYDLSSLWKAKTGLPFVFAVWVANRVWAEANPTSLQSINQALIQSREQFFSAPTLFQAGLQKAQAKSHLPPETLERYYRQCLTYGLSTAHHQALKHFDTILQKADRREGQPLER